MKRSDIVIVGLGEVGKPLYDVISKHHETIGVDISPVKQVGHVEILHVCYPFQIKDFIGETARYIALYKPSLTIINSTVAVGTTRAVAARTGAAVVNSPVRGKHTRMREELLNYRKFVGALDTVSAQRASMHFQSVGMKTQVLASPEATELAKLTETTYFGLMIAWAQEVERCCDQTDQKYEEVISFYNEIGFFPPVAYFPGVIGGHCVMPNIEMLRELDGTVMVEAIRTSNQMKVARENQQQETAAAVAAGVA